VDGAQGQQKYDGLGGHISTYASSATLYEIGFNHSSRVRTATASGDQVYFRAPSPPLSLFASFWRGGLTIDHMEHFRRETSAGEGSASYPHPRLMVRLLEFPTVSMGLGPIGAIYQARLNSLHGNPRPRDTSKSHCGASSGGCETDEPETLGALASRPGEKLDNLTFVVNCTCQRLDGPVRATARSSRTRSSVPWLGLGSR